MSAAACVKLLQTNLCEAADLLGVVTELTDDDGRQRHFLAFERVVANRALLGVGHAQGFELVEEPFGHVLDILDVATHQLMPN